MYYKKDLDETIKNLNSNLNGLSQNEAKSRLAKYGYNELKENEKVPTWKLFLESFNNSFAEALAKLNKK